MGLNLLKYFISADEDLPPSYVKKCKKFLDSIGPPQYYGGSNTGGRIFKVNKSSSAKLQEGIDYEVDNIDDYIKRVKSSQAGGPSHKEPGFKR